jgi:hypothetical protein
MRKLERFASALSGAGINYEIQGNMIGFASRTGNVWHWFREEFEMIFFDHSYSRNTGSIKRGAMRGINIKLALERSHGIMI